MRKTAVALLVGCGLLFGGGERSVDVSAEKKRAGLLFGLAEP